MQRLLSALPVSALALALALAPATSFAFEVPPNDGFVTDTAGILKQEEDAQLEQMLGDYQKQTSNEIAVVILQSLNGEPIADAAVAIGRKWGIGTQEKNNGVLLVIAYEDHSIFLATGYGLEGALPDIVAKGIIDTEIAPAFREGNYFEGVTAGVLAIEKHIAGEYTADRYASGTAGGALFPWFLFFVFIIFNWCAAVFAKTKSWWLGGIVGGALGILYTFFFAFWYSIPILVITGLVFDYVVSQSTHSRKWGMGGSGGRWGGMGGGSGSGGFGGFGGGSFGGGGASGKW